jgi:uncharacterized protein (DUF1810 family)
MDDPFQLQRFVAAQDADGTYDEALSELKNGRKVSHWMWFVFPQLAGLGQSFMARKYAISSRAEARAYREHPVLGPRLTACVQVLLAGRETEAVDIFGGIDAVKLRSSMTLFQAAAPEDGAYQAVLDKYFDGRADPATTGRLPPADR